MIKIRYKPKIGYKICISFPKFFFAALRAAHSQLHFRPRIKFSFTIPYDRKKHLDSVARIALSSLQQMFSYAKRELNEPHEPFSSPTQGTTVTVDSLRCASESDETVAIPSHCNGISESGRVIPRCAFGRERRNQPFQTQQNPCLDSLRIY